MTEAIDATRAVGVTGYADRTILKDTLNIVLAKSEEESDIFSQMFDTYFAMPETRQKQSSDQDQEKDQETSSESPDFSARDGDDPNDVQATQSLMRLASQRSSEERMATLQRISDAVGVDDIRFASQRSYYSRQMMREMNVEALENLLKNRFEDGSEEAKSEADTLMKARSQLQSAVREYIDHRFEIFGRAATQTFLNDIVANREIGELDGRDLARMKVLIARMAKKLASQHSRRRRPRQRGMIDVPRTLRKNAGHGGVPFDLVLKRKRLDKPKVVAICDVSGSVSRYVRFLLMFLYSLNETIPRLNAYAFSSQLTDVSDWFDQMGFEPAMKRIIRDIGSGSTDYGQSLLDVKTQYWDQIDRRTSVIILGDGRSNQTDPRVDILAQIEQRAKRLIWLCPEDPRRWGTGDSCMLRYAPHCHSVAHCTSANDLAVALDQVLRAYD